MKLKLPKLLRWREHRATCLATHPYSKAIFCIRLSKHEGQHQASANALAPNDDGTDFNMTAHPDSVAWDD